MSTPGLSAACVQWLPGVLQPCKGAELALASVPVPVFLPTPSLSHFQVAEAACPACCGRSLCLSIHPVPSLALLRDGEVPLLGFSTHFLLLLLPSKLLEMECAFAGVSGCFVLAGGCGVALPNLNFGHPGSKRWPRGALAGLSTDKSS